MSNILKITMMKKLLISSMLCLMTIASEAQVMTAATVNKVYNKAIADCKNEFFYNTELDDNNQITAMYVYKNKGKNKDNASLRPFCLYRYEYTADGLLTKRTMYVWRHNNWHCKGCHQYSLDNATYQIAYSRWNKKKGDFNEPMGKMTYQLLPDETVNSIACYQRHRENAPMKLEWQVSVEERFLETLPYSHTDLARGFREDGKE